MLMIIHTAEGNLWHNVMETDMAADYPNMTFIEK